MESLFQDLLNNSAAGVIIKLFEGCRVLTKNELEKLLL